MTTVYLSRIQLNPQRRDTRWLLASPQRIHAAVLASFPAPPTGTLNGAPRVLWRLDDDRGRVFLYVVSPAEPDFAHLAEQAGWPTTERGVVREYSPLLDRLAVGQRWAFRLTANPTRYETHRETGRAQRYGHVTVAYQEQWLLERAERHGFRVTSTARAGLDGTTTNEVPDLVLTRRQMLNFDRRDRELLTSNSRSKRQVTLTTAQYDGRLEIIDADALRGALVRGIGPAKAYGCGLLTLASVG